MIIKQFKNACLLKRNMITYQGDDLDRKQYKLVLLGRCNSQQFNELLNKCAIGELTTKQAISQLKLDPAPPRNSKIYTQEECPTYKWHQRVSDFNKDLQQELIVAFESAVQKKAKYLLDEALEELRAMTSIISYMPMKSQSEKEMIITAGQTLKKITSDK